MPLAFTPDEIIAVVQPREVRGSTTEKVRNLAALESAVAGDLSFLANPKYKANVATSRASVLLLPADFEGQPPAGQLWLMLENPSLGLTQLCRRVEQMLWPKPAAGVHPSAVVAPGATISPSATVGPLCVIEAGAKIGDRTVLEAAVFVGRDAVIGPDSWLMAHTVVASACVLGQRVRLQPGAVIGSDGYGYNTVNGRHEKIPQIGNVVLGDDVEIGANTTIDRARFSRTSIGEGTKIDNLVQIAHNCVIGKHCLIVSQVGIAGSTTLGDYVIVAGQAGLAGHLKVGSFSKIGGGAALTQDLEPKSYVTGQYAIPFMLEQKFQVLRPKIPELFKRVARIEEQLGLDPRKKPSS